MRLDEGRLQFSHRFHGRDPDTIVSIDTFFGQTHRNNVIHVAIFECFVSQSVGTQCILVLFFPRYFERGRQPISRMTHDFPRRELSYTRDLDISMHQQLILVITSFETIYFWNQKRWAQFR